LSKFRTAAIDVAMQFKPDEIERSSSESKCESSYLLFQPQRGVGQGQGGFALLAKPLTGVAAEAIRGAVFSAKVS